MRRPVASYRVNHRVNQWAANVSLDWVARQIIGAPGRRRPAFNPRPPGVMRPDSASETVYQFLKNNPGRYYFMAHIVNQTGRTYKSVSWAVIFLSARGFIARIEHDQPGLNSRYLRYGVPVSNGVNDE